VGMYVHTKIQKSSETEESHIRRERTNTQPWSCVQTRLTSRKTLPVTATTVCDFHSTSMCCFRHCYGSSLRHVQGFAEGLLGACDGLACVGLQSGMGSASANASDERTARVGCRTQTVQKRTREGDGAY
jgi:L-aminopeptidase/D-esterase-like protein